MILVRLAGWITWPGSEHQGYELRAQTTRNVNGLAIRRELRYPVEYAAVNQRNLVSFV
jgi:hypothetical protein